MQLFVTYATNVRYLGLSKLLLPLGQRFIHFERLCENRTGVYSWFYPNLLVVLSMQSSEGAESATGVLTISMVHFLVT